MDPGLRIHKSASLRVAVPEALPAHMQPHMRELLSIVADNPRNGHASALMHQVCHEADCDCVTLLVQVKAFQDGMTDEQLRKWYARFNFVVLQEEPALMMARQVVPNRIARLH